MPNSCPTTISVGTFLRQVQVRVAHAGAVEQQRVVEQRAVAVRRRLQLLEEVGEQLHVERVELRLAAPASRGCSGGATAGDARRARRSPDTTATLTSRAIRNVKTRVRSVWYASTCRSNISLACSSKVGGMPTGCSTTGSSRVDLLLGLLDAALDVAHGVEVLVQLRAVAAAEPALAGRCTLPRHRVEDAAVRSGARAGARVGSVLSLAPNSRSNTARGLFSIGSGVVGVRQEMRVGVGAAVAVARRLPTRSVGFERQLERAELRLLAELRGDDLIQRHAGADVGALGLLRAARRSATPSATRGCWPAVASTSPAALSRPLTTSMRSLNGSSGCRIGDQLQRARPAAASTAHVDSPSPT